MRQTVTLIVVANGQIARFFVRHGDQAPLAERTDLRMRATLHEPDSFFCADVADKTACLLADLGASRLVLCAASETLGSLRSFLPAPAMRLLSASLALDMIKSALETISVAVEKAENAVLAVPEQPSIAA